MNYISIIILSATMFVMGLWIGIFLGRDILR